MSCGEKTIERNTAYNLATASGADLRVLHRVATVAVATIDLAKLPSLSGGLEIRSTIE
jgi:hypothetical protein